MKNEILKIKIKLENEKKFFVCLWKLLLREAY